MSWGVGVRRAARGPVSVTELSACALKKRYAGRWVVDGVNLVLRPGEIVGLLGPNGAGKTVTFSMISGLTRPDAGTIWLNGEDITRLPMHQRARRGIAYLSQERSVFRGLTVLENVAAVLEVRGSSRHDALGQARKVLHQFGLARLADSRATHLSGGEQRRLEVARSVATSPRFLLSDEPLAGIDPLTIEMLRGLFLKLRDDGLGILLTDHNVKDTLALCDRAYVLFDGHVLAHGTPAELAENAEVRHNFLGEAFSLLGVALRGREGAREATLAMAGTGQAT